MTGGVAASALLAAMHPTTPRPVIALSLLLHGIAAGLSQQTVVIAAQAAAPANQVGAATGAITFARLAGSSLGVAFFGAVLNARLPAALTAAGPVRLDAAYAAALNTVFAASIPLLLIGLATTALKPAKFDTPGKTKQPPTCSRTERSSTPLHHQECCNHRENPGILLWDTVAVVRRQRARV